MIGKADTWPGTVTGYLQLVYKRFLGYNLLICDEDTSKNNKRFSKNVTLGTILMTEVTLRKSLF